MSFIANLLSVKPDPTAFNNIHPIQTNKELFHVHLLSYSEVTMSVDMCIGQCCNSIKAVLTESDCDLSETSQKTLGHYLENFDRLVDRKSFRFENFEKNVLKTKFKSSFGEVVKEKWAAAKAKEFSPILKMDNEKQKVVALESWTKQFFAGVDYFSQWDKTDVNHQFVDALREKVISAFHQVSDQANREMIQTALARAEKMPIQSSLSQKDKIHLGAENASMIIRVQAEVSQGAHLMKRCIRTGDIFLKFKSITPETSYALFAGVIPQSKL
jgi:hypothetical protein